MDYKAQIISFLMGELPDQEMLAFQQAFESDVQLQEEVKLHQEILFTIKQGEDDDVLSFRKQLGEIGDDFIEGTTKSRKLPVFAWAAAATIIAFLGIGGVLGLFPGGDFNSDQIFSQYYEPYSVGIVVRGEDNSQVSELDEAIRLYMEGNIDTALSAFTTIKIENPEVAGFYLGLCYMENGHFQEAIDEFQSVSNDAIFYSDHISWYWSLALVKQGDEQGALPILKELVSSDEYGTNAKKILSKIN
ncbi:tetratricopeptide repeat protein [Marinilabiliaceae bacterium JC017]|nr:tetratricopeptide repeat protein [Marinilabiliaceae bacterium JC017]